MVDLFDKLYNYEFRSRLQANCDNLLITGDERSWLKWSLQRPEAEWFLDQETIDDLQDALRDSEAFCPDSGFYEQGRRVPPLLDGGIFQDLLRFIKQQQGIRLDYCLNDGRPPLITDGMPLFLEFSVARQEWYLLWTGVTAGCSCPMTTPLRNIAYVADIEINLSYETARQIWNQFWAESSRELLLEVLADDEGERPRILQALSAFGRKIDRDLADGAYRIVVYYLADEEEYLLQKIRRLGRKVRIISPERIRARIAKTACEALARYR